MDLKSLISNDEAECRLAFKKLREHQGIVCKKCMKKEHYWLSGKEQWKCKGCGFRTTLKSGTLLQNSNLPINTWFEAIHIITSNPEGVSANKLKTLLNKKNYETAWRLYHKVRKLINEVEFDSVTTKIKQYSFPNGKRKEVPYSASKDFLVYEPRLRPVHNASSNRIHIKSSYSKFKSILNNIKNSCSGWFDSSREMIDHFDHINTKTLRSLLQLHINISYKYLQNYLSLKIYMSNRVNQSHSIQRDLWDNLGRQLFPTRSSGIIPDTFTRTPSPTSKNNQPLQA